ncbi:MAG: type II toxin-antitoxin system MqsA family antitoxin [Chloroflexota bacterium]|nr:type II toxin-antitoxin system MqsA family antitoxin [Chloroflexota bacterium]
MAGTGWTPHNLNVMNCAFCKGDIEEKTITYIAEYRDRVVIIENVPAEVCTQCGEKFIRPEVAEKIQRLVWEQPSPRRSTEVPVYDLAEVA